VLSLLSTFSGNVMEEEMNTDEGLKIPAVAGGCAAVPESKTSPFLKPFLSKCSSLLPMSESQLKNHKQQTQKPRSTNYYSKILRKKTKGTKRRRKNLCFLSSSLIPVRFATVLVEIADGIVAFGESEFGTMWDGIVSDFFVLLLLGSDCLSCCWVCFGFWFRFCDDDGLGKICSCGVLEKSRFFNGFDSEKKRKLWIRVYDVTCAAATVVLGQCEKMTVYL